uniref:ATP-dependent DNA helicase II subunit 2 n=1 Tax=Psilocybe cubensis TaxID=181762 RepID=A0A8H7Y8Y4_PSICU
MPADRAGYTVTMFLVDASSSMGNVREVEVENADGSTRTVEMTNLQWGLQYVKLKVQEMIFNGRKTDQCGVIVFGSKNTNNHLNKTKGGYENVVEYIPIGKPNAKTLARIDALQPSDTSGDPIDALIVGIDTQSRYLGTKKTWTRKIVIVTDGESPIEVEDWEATVAKMDELEVKLTVVGVDFDDEELPYAEADKSNIKRVNESFYHQLTSSMNSGVVGTCAYALRETTAPEVKQTKSVLVGTQLRIGDFAARSDEAIEVPVKMSKCTALARPKSWKKFVLMQKEKDAMEVDNDVSVYSQVTGQTQFAVQEDEDEEKEKEKVKQEDVKMEENDEAQVPPKTKGLQVEKEELTKGFKYGTTFVPVPEGEGQFMRLTTHKGIDLISFFAADTFRRELAMGEIYYIWADTSRPVEQVALSSIVQAMNERKLMAIGRFVSRDGMDPKMGVLAPILFEDVDCLLWIPTPFADDVRKYTFGSLDTLINKKGEVLTEHPYLPTEEQLSAMDDFVDALDLMDAGEKNEDGVREPWFDTRESYNPAIHRVKQAMFHSAVVKDVVEYPVPPPHPETTKYFEPPKRVLRRAKEAIEECKNAFNVKQVPKRTARTKKDEFSRAADGNEEAALLAKFLGPASSRDKETQAQSQMNVVEAEPSHPQLSVRSDDAEASETEDEDEESAMAVDMKKPATPLPEASSSSRPPLPTPARSMSPNAEDNSPARIISNARPLEDFKENIAQGDVVSKAVKDLAEVVVEEVLKPFATRRADEMVECMVVLRKTCLEEDEIDAWNAFLRDLKEKCLTKPGNPNFWDKIRDVGRRLSLISKHEAKKLGGISDVTGDEAEEFVE